MCARLEKETSHANLRLSVSLLSLIKLFKLDPPLFLSPFEILLYQLVPTHLWLGAAFCDSQSLPCFRDFCTVQTLTRA